MNEVQKLLEKVSSGEMPIEEAVLILRSQIFKTTELVDATLDHHRVLRQGMAEVVYGQFKSNDQILRIVAELENSGTPVLITRVDEEKRKALRESYPRGRENSLAQTFILNAPERKKVSSSTPFVGIVSAGTSDRSVAEEAAETCLAMDVAFELIQDVGVAGLHRILNKIDLLQRASALVVIAGMEGALPTVVGGLVDCPVFAVPTSVGYGASFQGVAALLAMLNSCSSGISVVNIDNGFSAAFSASSVVRKMEQWNRRER